MGRGEASKPQRHSSHHLRYYQSYGHRNSYERSDDRPRLKHQRRRHKDELILAEPKRASQAQTRYDVVENWLEQNARQCPHPDPSRSQGHRGDVIGDDRPPRLHDATPPYNKHSKHADPGWRPRHVFPGNSVRQSGPLQELGLGDARKSTRRWAAPSDSSFISGFENSTMPLKHDPESARREYGNTPLVHPLREAGLDHLNASSTTSHIDESVKFEKRPRHKTREDKYETGKKRRRGEENNADHGDHQKKKRKKSEKRKSMASSKNVVNNFTSDAVLNDRITVQPHLKPGLFDNRRTSKKQPISDLAFSEMQFLKHQKRNIQPKALSKSRLREKRRDDREIEEVSTFFLPPQADENAHKSRRQRSGTRNDQVDLQRLSRQSGTECSQELSKSPPSNHPTRFKYLHIPRDETIRASSIDLHGHTGGRQGSDKNTTYFTSSSSRHSPRINTKEDRTSPNISGSVWTSTPEPIRREIIATGVFRDTGIPAYDNEQGTGRIAEASLPDAHRMQLEDDRRHLDHWKLNKPPKVKYRDQAMMTDDPPNRLDRSRRNSFTPEWRHEYGVESGPLGNHMKENHRRPNSQAPDDLLEVDRQQIARGIRLTPIEKGDLGQNIQTPSMLSTQISSTHQSPKLVDTQTNPNQGNQTQGTGGRTSVASRDAMPPPPIPSSTNRSIPASAEDTHCSGQNSSLINTAPVESQPSPAEDFNSNIPDTHETAQSRNPIASSFELPSNINRTLPSFDTITWIPQRIPSARIAESRSIPSRLSMNSSIYINQLEGDSNGGSYRGDPISKSHVPESMAEFIARIEGESQVQSRAHDCDILDSRSGQDEIALNAHPFEQPSVYYAEEDTHPKPAGDLSFPYLDSGDAGIEQQAEDSYAEAQHLQYDPGDSFPVGQPAEDLEEHSEMMSFWRPNQFSWF
ncbi:hypothetical protein F4818DRAFT_166293 [Hypoxylon cercidicola]|nr:hypothetical protein F4818DRAFT_166293 [Hypoxylon cercidicola]